MIGPIGENEQRATLRTETKKAKADEIFFLTACGRLVRMDKEREGSGDSPFLSLRNVRPPFLCAGGGGLRGGIIICAKVGDVVNFRAEVKDS